jgi:hypothetical protein
MQMAGLKAALSVYSMLKNKIDLVKINPDEVIKNTK